MRITSITINNLAAFKGEVKFTFGAVSLIEGRHGAGKSSLEQVLMYLLGRRPLATKGARSIMHDPSILHGNSDRGEAVVTFDEGDIELLRVVVKSDKTTREVKMRGSKRWEDAGQLIDDITNALAYDPMQFKDLAPKERLEAFLRVVPVEISPEELTEAVGGLIPLPPGTPRPESINSLYDDIYRLRTTENVAYDTQKKHADQLEAALPPATEEGGNWNAEVAKHRERKSVLEKSEAEEIKRIGTELQAAKDAAAQKRRSDEETINRALASVIGDIDRQIRELEVRKAALRDEANQKILTFAQDETDVIEAARTRANTEAKEIREANAQLHASILTDIATAEERSRSLAQAEGTRAAAQHARAEAEAHKVKSSAMTAALERLTKLKAEIAGRMKVKGVVIATPRDGQPVDLCRPEGDALVPFSRWNDADKDAFALRMAVLFRGPCGIVCVDNMANWNAERREAIIARCKVLAAENKMQFLLGLASGGELRVTEA